MYLASVQYFYKIRSAFLVLCNGEQYVYIEILVYLNSFFALFFLPLVLLSHNQLSGYYWGDRLNNSMLMTDCPFAANFTWRSRRASWVGIVLMEYPKGFNWQHSNFYIMPQTTDPFCHTVLPVIFVKSNMLISFNLLTHKYWENM